MSDCLFCKIVQGQIPCQKVFENDDVLGFKDIAPMAKEHYLFVHKNHTSNVNQLAKEQPQQLAQIFSAIASFTAEGELQQEGFRVVVNQGANAGQTVFHTHFHVLGGEKLGRFGSH